MHEQKLIFDKKIEQILIESNVMDEVQRLASEAAKAFDDMSRTSGSDGISKNIKRHGDLVDELHEHVKRAMQKQREIERLDRLDHKSGRFTLYTRNSEGNQYLYLDGISKPLIYLNEGLVDLGVLESLLGDLFGDHGDD